jgi:hypothetical protein
MKPTRYQITLTGASGDRTPAMFPDCEISVEHGHTILYAELADQAALHGLIDRIASLGFELSELRQLDSGDR